MDLCKQTRFVGKPSTERGLWESTNKTWHCYRNVDIRFMSVVWHTQLIVCQIKWHRFPNPGISFLYSLPRSKSDKPQLTQSGSCFAQATHNTLACWLSSQTNRAPFCPAGRRTSPPPHKMDAPWGIVPGKIYCGIWCLLFRCPALGNLHFSNATLLRL